MWNWSGTALPIFPTLLRALGCGAGDKCPTLGLWDLSFLGRVPGPLIQTVMMTYFANVNSELGIHENRLDVHGALLEIESWKHQIGDRGQYFHSPHISEHQGCLLGPDVLACKLSKKRFQRSGHSKSFLRTPILSYTSDLKQVDQTNKQSHQYTLWKYLLSSFIHSLVIKNGNSVFRHQRG